MANTRKQQLQQMLGDAGTVLPRIEHGSPARPAQGWYAQMHTGPRNGHEVFLGDYAMLAGMMIGRLLKEIEQPATAKPKPRARKQRSAPARA